MSNQQPNSKNKVALVTGSSKRVGRQLIIALAETGYDVWIHYHTSQTEAHDLANILKQKGHTAHCVAGDIRKKEDVQGMVQKVREVSGHLNVLINNIGEYKCAPLLKYPVDDFESTIQSNLLGSFYMIHYALPLLQRGASIINLGYSGISSLVAHPYNAAYSISKLGLLSLTKSYAYELGHKGIRVNMISPGQLDNSIDLPQNFDQQVPLGRAGTVQDISNTMLFLISEKASYITGQNIDVSGGYMMKLED
jgi:3-oxoacyl-[acyl-carrier protein] reductase